MQESSNVFKTGNRELHFKRVPIINVEDENDDDHEDDDDDSEVRFSQLFYE